MRHQIEFQSLKKSESEYDYDASIPVAYFCGSKTCWKIISVGSSNVKEGQFLFLKMGHQIEFQD